MTKKEKSDVGHGFVESAFLSVAVIALLGSIMWSLGIDIPNGDAGKILTADNWFERFFLAVVAFGFYAILRFLRQTFSSYENKETNQTPDK